MFQYFQSLSVAQAAWTHSIARAGLELATQLPHLSSAAVTGMGHHARPSPINFYVDVYFKSLGYLS